MRVLSREKLNDTNNYIDIKINGRLFPSWVLANFKDFKLPPIFRKENEDPCKLKQKDELRKYQLFFSKFMNYKSPYHDILVYHGLGSGKTASAINIYNMLYNYTPAWNVFILIKASLRDHPWMDDIKKWLSKDDYEYRFKNIIFVHYDSPTADVQFLNSVREADSSKKSLYIIEEAHNFIRNVYSNISSKSGRRAQTIYDHIIQDKQENEGTRVVCLSATPAINVPFELALLFNMLRPGIFPKSENEFNNIYVSNLGYPSINKTTKNMFQRRIMGLVSYYYGATPDLYASQSTDYVEVPMDKYQEHIYSFFEDIEEQLARKKRMRGIGSGDGGEMYKSYTRQASNFVFPHIDQHITGENRPRPNKFRLNEREALKIDEGKNKLKLEKGTEKYMNVSKYVDAMKQFIKSFDNWLGEKQKEDIKNGHTIDKDLKVFLTKYNGNFLDFDEKEKKKSNLYQGMAQCSKKYVAVIFNIAKSKGPVLVYSNYVLMEGLQTFKIYLKYFGFASVNDNTGKDYMKYAEYHGGIKDISERRKYVHLYNEQNNKDGKLIKIMMISPAGSEGITLYSVRQVHLMEPYWNEVRMIQMIGRAVRACSHRYLPMQDRHVDVFRYKSVRKSGTKLTTDQYIEDAARSKQGLIKSFLDSIKEVAVDCVLYKSINTAVEDYKCFQFDEPSLFDKYIGPAYKEDIYDDIRLNNGSNSQKSRTVKVKVMKINAVKLLSESVYDDDLKVSKSENYWLNNDTGVVYDFDLKYPIGKIAYDDNMIPIKTDKDTYLIDKLIPIPLLNVN